MSDRVTNDEILRQTIDRFWESVPPTWHRIRHHVRGIAVREFGISVEQFHILRHIRKGLGSVSELAEARGISRPAISQAVEILVNKGLISRGPHHGDRRFVRLTLTKDGEELLSAIFSDNRVWMTEKLSGLSPAQLSVVIEAMGLLKAAFEDNPESP